MKRFAILLVLIVVIGAAAWSLKGNATVVESDLTVEGDYTVGDKDVVLKNGAKLAVKGNLTVDGELRCDDGPLQVSATGNVVIKGTVKCERPGETEDSGANSITIVAKSGLTVDANAVVASNGHVQVVSDEGLLVNSQADVGKLFDETGADTGTGPRVGPFVVGNDAPVSFVPTYHLADARPWFIPAAKAADPLDNEGNVVGNVVIGGKWFIGNGENPPGGLDVPTPPKGINKIILNFNFGAGGNVQLRDFYLAGPDGADGKEDIGKNCNAVGTDGKDAFRFRVQAGNITLNNFTLELGDGGTGGSAETIKDCDPGVARGGKGGEAGNFKMTATGAITINSFHIIPGRGGNGGEATAKGKEGKDGCPGEKGGDARATGGDGGKNKKDLAAIGAVTGVGNVTFAATQGGDGGRATAEPGKGGNGTACKCNGGKGGNGTAIGGKGGDASVRVGNAFAKADGGDGGDAGSFGGVGGTGGHCPLKPTGGNGGNGGDAKSTVGKGGLANPANGANGQDGDVKDETGGNGGNGGDGCGPGNGGKGGQGDPLGKDGEPGKLICPTASPSPTPTSTGTVRTPTPTATPVTTSGQTKTPTPTPTPPRETQKIKVIQYQGKYLPVDQLLIEAEQGCDGGQPHWHAIEGVVLATDGTQVPDPGPQCGYGKQNQTPVIEIEVK